MNRSVRWLFLIALAGSAAAARADCESEATRTLVAGQDKYELARICRYADAARAAGLAPLETTPLAEGESEIRIWFSFSAFADQPVLRLRRHRRGSVDGALYRHYSLEYADAPEHREFRRYLRDNGCIEPARGQEMGICRRKYDHPPRWRELHGWLVATGIESLPDQSTLPPPNDGISISDGHAMTVEIRNGQGYRRYTYVNPRGDGAEVEAAWQILNRTWRFFPPGH